MKQSHYYFADSEQGAKAEINIHNRGAEVQVARLRPKRSIRMICRKRLRLRINS